MTLVEARVAFVEAYGEDFLYDLDMTLIRGRFGWENALDVLERSRVFPPALLRAPIDLALTLRYHAYIKEVVDDFSLFSV